VTITSTVVAYGGIVPARSDSQANFNTNMQSMFTYFPTIASSINAVSIEMNAVASEVNNNAISAATSADMAAASTVSAIAAAGVTLWAVGVSYTTPACVAGSDGATYRCKGTGIVGDNPVGSVTGNWLRLTIAAPTVNVITANFNILADINYLVNTSTIAITGTLPASPAPGQKINVGDYSGTFQEKNCTIGRNGKLIMGLAEDLILNKDCFINMIYVDATIGWRLI